MGIMYLIQISTTNPYTTLNGINFTLPCVSLSLGLNILLTIIIVLRLLTFRYRIISVMGPKYGTSYISAAAMVIESAALYSLISITFLVLLGIQNAVSRVFAQSLIQFQVMVIRIIHFAGSHEHSPDNCYNADRVPSSPGERMEAEYCYVFDVWIRPFRAGQRAFRLSRSSCYSRKISVVVKGEVLMAASVYQINNVPVSMVVV